MSPDERCQELLVSAPDLADNGGTIWLTPLFVTRKGQGRAVGRDAHNMNCFTFHSHAALSESRGHVKLSDMHLGFQVFG